MSKESARRPAPAWWRPPLLAGAMACLAVAVWGGLARLPVEVPLPGRAERWVLVHGPLMVCAFLGAVISLERAVGLPGRWPFLAPLLCVMAGAHLVAGGSPRTGAALFTAASVVFTAVTGWIVRLRPELFTRLLCAGAGCWLGGNVLWLAGAAFPAVVPWWIAFLALTIVGERVDLSRFQKPNPWAPALLRVALAVFLVGVVTTGWSATGGQRLLGTGLLCVAGWLGRFDLAWRTVRQPGLPRFMSLCLLLGFGWLAVAGGLFVGFAPVSAGFAYDAALHAFFVGFVVSMIFGHAPVIFPSVLGLRMAYHPVFYVHMAVLHGALLLRVASDAAEWLPGRRWGGVLNGVALALFVANTAAAVLRVQRAQRTPARRAARR